VLLAKALVYFMFAWGGIFMAAAAMDGVSPAALIGAPLGLLAAHCALRKLRQDEAFGGSRRILARGEHKLSGGTEQQRASFDEAVEDYGFIEKALPEVHDMQLRASLLQMQKLAGNILDYLVRHPESIAPARQFMDYYQNRAALLLRRYLEIDGLQLDTPGVQSVKERTKSLLSVDIYNAYKQQFEKIINHQLLDLDAEIKVLEESMKADGLCVSTHSSRSLPLANDEVSHAALDEGMANVEVTYAELRSRAAKRAGSDKPDAKREAEAAGSGGEKIQSGTAVYTSDVKSALPERLPPIDSWFARLVGTLGIGDTVTERKLCTAGFAIFFGSFGLHKFYLGKNFWGFLYLCFFWTTIPGIIGLFEGVRFLFMTRENFYREYC